MYKHQGNFRTELTSSADYFVRLFVRHLTIGPHVSVRLICIGALVLYANVQNYVPAEVQIFWTSWGLLLWLK